MGAAPPAAPVAAPPDAPKGCYRRRRAKSTPLYRLVHAHWPEYQAVHEEQVEPRHGRLRAEVARTVEAYLRCGVLEHGFARIRCGDCGHELLVAFSCKGRGLCPSCAKKRQLEFGDFVTTEVLEAVPHRHLVFTIPRRLRLHFRYDRRLLTGLARAAYRVVEGTTREAAGDRRLRPGAVAAVQTFGSLLDFHPHIHMLVTDGGFAPEDPAGRFVRTEPAPPEVLEDLFRHRVFRFLLDEDAISEELVENLLTWPHSGFGVHVGRPIAGEDGRALAAVSEYLVRGPIALSRLKVEETESGPRVTLRASRYHPRHKSDRRMFEPLEFLATLFAHIPGTHEKTVVYYGHYSNRSRGQRKKEAGAARVGPAPELGPVGPVLDDPGDDNDDEPFAKAARRRWAALIRRVYETDPLVCPKCRGDMQVVSFIMEEDVVFRILRHLELFEPEPPAAAVRGPPRGDDGELFGGLEREDVVPGPPEETPEESDEAARREVEALDALEEAHVNGHHLLRS